MKIVAIVIAIARQSPFFFKMIASRVLLDKL